MTDRQVTEMDFRMPEFRDARVEDYEFRADGKLVRKDRWERAVASIRFLVGIDGREFEIEDIIGAVRKMAVEQEGWLAIADMDPPDYPRDGCAVSIRLTDGSVLRNAQYAMAEKLWRWCGIEYAEEVVAWREERGLLYRTAKDSQVNSTCLSG